MALVPGPTIGSPGGGAYLMRHPQFFKGLSMGPALTGLSGMIYLADYIRARRHDMSVQEYRYRLSDRVLTDITIPLSNLLLGATAPVHTVEGSSSETYQQNGGPSALHQQGRPVPVVKPAAKPSAHGGGGSGAKPRRKRCPYSFRKGRWAHGILPHNKGRCVKRAGHSGRHSQFYRPSGRQF